MITITAASSQFGRVVLDELLNRGVPAGEIVAGSRDVTKLSDYATRGVQVRHLDYNDPATIEAALADVDRLLLVSSSAFGQLVAQHTNVINAAKKADVNHIAYTSFLNADTSGMVMAQPHAETEKLIKDSGIPFTILRNGNYLENYSNFVGFWIQYHQAMGAAGDAKISFASRTDLAQAAAILLTGDLPANTTHDLAGPAYTMADLVATAAAVADTEIAYVNMTKDDYAATLASGGVPAPLAAGLADLNAGAQGGGWYTDSTELETVLGRPATTPREVFTAAIAAGQQY